MDNINKETIEKVLDVIQKEINKHNNEKETIENEISSIHNEQIKEEGMQDIAKLEKTIAGFEEEKQSFLALVYERDTNERSAEEVNKTLEQMKTTKQHLLEEQQQCRAEISKINERTYFKEEEKPVELREYESDLIKITSELDLLDAKIAEYNKELIHISNINEQIDQSINATLEKYHIQIGQDMEQSKTEEPKPEQPKPEDPKPEKPEQEQSKPEEPKPEQPKPEEPKPEEPKPEQPKPEEPKPEEPKPKQPKPEGPKPEQPKPEQPKPEQPKPEQPKPEQPKPEQPKPVQQKPEGPKPEGPRPVQPKPERLVPEISQINLDEEANWIEVLDKAGNVIFTENMRSYKIRKNMSEEFKERLGKRCKEVKEEIGKNKYKGIDERVLMLLEDMGTEDMIAQYVKSIAEKKAEMPFSIEYNLKNIYKDKKYTLDGIKQINKWAKIAKKQNKDKVYVDKDKLLKRALDNLRFKKEKGLLLPAPLKEIHSISETKEMLGKGKEVIPEKVKEIASKGKEVVERGRETLIQKGKDVKHFTSKKIDNLRNCNAKQFGREALGTLKIMGAKTLGYIRRENPLVTQMRVNQIREKSFTERLKENVHVNEEVAIKKVEASKSEAKNQEVVIENPDGTKVAATRLWSRDD